jgi:ABC-type uncharacterized transport system ATPase component
VHNNTHSTTVMIAENMADTIKVGGRTSTEQDSE